MMHVQPSSQAGGYSWERTLLDSSASLVKLCSLTAFDFCPEFAFQAWGQGLRWGQGLVRVGAQLKLGLSLGSELVLSQGHGSGSWSLKTRPRSGFSLGSKLSLGSGLSLGSKLSLRSGPSLESGLSVGSRLSLGARLSLGSGFSPGYSLSLRTCSVSLS